MDFENIECDYSSSNLFNVVLIRESGFSQDAQYRSRKSPRKKLKVARTSASLVIDQLKNVFWCPDDFTSRVRTRRNWYPEFLMWHLRNNRCDCKERCNAILRSDKRNFIPVAPKIYSIGLHSGARNLSDSDNLSSLCGAIRNFRKRFSIVRRPMIACKYVTQSTSTSSLLIDASLKANNTDRQAVAIDCTESTEITPKFNRTQESNRNSHHSQSHVHVEKNENTSDTLRNDRTADDRSFIRDDFKDPYVREDQKCSSTPTTRDAQIQTSNRKSSRRRKTKRRSKLTTERISRHRHCDDEPRIVTNFRTGSNRRNHRDEPWLRVRVLEDKRAEYINKFTAVNRQIEEITAALRETCCDGENSRDNLENCDEYFSSISDDAKVNSMVVNWSGVDNRSTIARERNTSKEKSGSVNVKRIVGESKSDRRKNVWKILHVGNLNNETVSFPKDSIAASRNPEKIPNDAFRCDSVRSTKETVYTSNRISWNKMKEKCRFVKPMSFDLNEKKNEDDELRSEFSIENKVSDRVCLKNNFTILNNNEHAKDLAKSPVDLEEPRYCKKIVEEKVGEMAILKDIKKRIDRDFDDPPAEVSENDTEDFFTASRKSSDLDRYNVTADVTIGEVRSTPLIASTSLDPAETQIHDSTSISAMSERSNKNSTLSKYFSCTRIPSLISLTENEDALAVGAVDRSTIDLHSYPHSSYHYYDLCSNLSLNNHSLSNLDSNLDRSRTLEYVVRYDPSVRYKSSPKFLIEMAKEPNEMIEDCESFAVNKSYEWLCPHLGESEGRGKERRAEKRCTADSTLETSKSSRCVGSMDSGVFSSSLIDLRTTEGSFDASKSKFKKKRRAGKHERNLSAAADFGTDGSCTDDTLDRKVNDVVKDLTKNLILCERRARMKLRARDSRHVLSRACKLNRNFYNTCCDFFYSPRRSSEDERIVSISTPSLLSLSDSEIEDCESRHVNMSFVNSNVYP
ncbi:PREDICTED: uncharacterized protein LOC105449324 isoform X2 [Wasmannia auropunctata]|uniref:uncharacterized protein LOC105449324 isoform X2 n=1 Tax=Wasmannia auropunctata TaxID=64793 RepID=UPI0005F0834A|nr:PREDICTED: uncharacterized protein LOC105449324 isoform X2 [Wasmannia auropunctata]